jgi:protein TonB
MPTVLIADRDEAYRKALGQVLQQRGIEVDGVSSGAHLYARAMAEDPDLIVMEADLEEMDGFQVFARLQRNRQDNPFRVIFLSRFDHPRVARVCKQRGALAYLTKKQSLEQVAATLEGVLTDRDPLQERKLPAAVAWLQSRGKSGRLDVEADGNSGFILLHNGMILDARWQNLQGQEAVRSLTEDLPEASFRFSEGADEEGLLEPAGAPELPEAPATNGSPAAAALLEVADGHVGNGSSATKDRVGRDLWDRLLEAEEPPKAPVGGAMAAVRELRSRELQEQSDKARSRARRRTLLGVAAVLALLLFGGLGLAVLFPEIVPTSMAGILGGFGWKVGEREIEEPVSPLARGGSDQVAQDPADGPNLVGTVTSAGEATSAGDMTGTADAASAGEATSDQEPAGPPSDNAEGDAAEANASAAEDAPGDAGSDEPAFTGDLATIEAVESQSSKRARESARRAEESSRRDPKESERSAAQSRRESTAEDSPREPSRKRPEPAAAAPQAPAPPAPVPVTSEEVPVELETGPATPPPTPTPVESAPEARQPAVADAGRDTESPAGGASATRTRRNRRVSDGIVQKPVLVQRGRDPYYPPELEAEGIGGSVVLNILVGTNGRAQRIEILRSSGFEAFDQAAVAAVGTFLWEPGRDVSGPTATWTSQAVTFRP